MRKLIFCCLVYFICFSGVNAESVYDKISSLSDNLDTLETRINEIEYHPVGSIYITTSNTNPSSTLGGEWEAYAQGRELIGTGTNSDTGTTYNYNTENGSSSNNLSTVNIPSHSHSLTATGSVSNVFSGNSVNTSTSGAHDHLSQVKIAPDYGLSTYSGHGCSHVKDSFFVSGGSLGSDSGSSGVSHYHTMTPTGTVTSSFTGTQVTSSEVGSGDSFSIQNPYVTVYMWKRVS